MRQLEKAALGAAVVLSVVSIGDAVLRATSDVVPPWDDESGVRWVVTAFGVLMAATFGLMAAVLVRNADRIDEGRGSRRWTRRLLAVDLGFLAAGYLVVSVVDADAAGAVAGVAFLAMFVLGVAFGAVLLRRPDVRVPALLMVSVVPVIGLTFALEALAPGWGHPGYAETVLYLGIALLGTQLADERAGSPVMAGAAR